MADARDQDEGAAANTPRGRRRFRTRRPRSATALTGREGARATRLLWVFLPETSIARSRQFQYVLASTFLSDGGRDAMRYGALVAVSTGGGSAMKAVLVALASLIPTAALAMVGGAIADAFPKRLALTLIYILQGGLCFVMPVLFGTGLGAILALIFAINVLGEVATPDEQSIAPLVASDAQLASATSLLSLASNAGTAVGTALLAPILLRVVGVRAVFFVAGVMLLVASGRIWQMRSARDLKPGSYHRPDIRLKSLFGALTDQPAVATMLLVGVLAGTANVVLQTLAPHYVSSVLQLDPANAVYVFAPSSAGLAVALATAPALMRKIGERHTAVIGFGVSTLSLFLLGLVRHHLDVVVDPMNPFRLLGVVGVHLSAPLRTASFLVMPLGFGVALTAMAVQTYINRRVPLAQQGRTFALQSTVKNAVSIVPLVALGGAATLVGVDTVLIATPLLLFVTAFALVRISLRATGHAPRGRLDVLASFWRESAETPTPA